MFCFVLFCIYVTGNSHVWPGPGSPQGRDAWVPSRMPGPATVGRRGVTSRVSPHRQQPGVLPRTAPRSPRVQSGCPSVRSSLGLAHRLQRLHHLRGLYPTKRDRRRQCNPACKPSSSDARFALDPEREGRRYTSPLKNIPAVPAGRALRGGTRVRGLEGLVDHRYESTNDGESAWAAPGGWPVATQPRG